MMGRSWLLLVLAGYLTMVPSVAVAESVYAPPGLYDSDRIRLDNGFQVLLNERRETRNVAYRLVVNVGTRHFDCADRETPHLLEHLLFSGTTRHSEAELEHRIADLGGSWNAVTGTEHTTYQLDIFDRNALKGLDALHEIVTNSVITPEKLALAKKIVYREEGGKPGGVRRFLFDLGISKRAWKKANEWLLPGDGAVCSGLVNMERITAEGIVNTYRTAYVPGNMTLIAVGNFDRSALLDRVSRTFGSMPGMPMPSLKVMTPPEPSDGPVSVSSTLTPFLGSGGSLSMAFRTVGRTDADAPALIVLNSYLSTRFYEEVRVKAGLSYAPETALFFQPDYGIFYATADVSVKNVERVRELMIGILDDLLHQRIAPDEAERTKRKILLQWAQGYETNAGLASFYEERLSLADRQKGLRSSVHPDILQGYEREIESVSPDDLERVIARYLRPERRVEIRSMPTMSYAAFFSVLGATALVIAAAVLYRVRRSGNLRKRMLPVYLRK